MAMMGKQVLDAGGIIIEVLTESATRANLDAWVATYKLPVTTVKDPDANGRQTIDALGRREYNFIVNLSDMTIVAFDQGDVFGNGTPSATVGMQKMITLLGM